MTTDLPFHKRILLERLYHARTYGYLGDVMVVENRVYYHCFNCRNSQSWLTLEKGKPWRIAFMDWRKFRLNVCSLCAINAMARGKASAQNYVRGTYG